MTELKVLCTLLPGHLTRGERRKRILIPAPTKKQIGDEYIEPLS